MFMIEEMLQIMKETDSISATKNIQKQLQKHPTQTVLENKNNHILDNDSSNSDSDCIIVAARS